MLVIGLAGGIGVGKSSVSDILSGLGASVINADRLGHEVYLPNTEGLETVVAAFGKEILLPSGEVDRRILGSKVFGNPEEMSKLNAIMWPRIREKLTNAMEEQAMAGTEVLVIDAAVLIEAGWTNAVDEVWIVTAPQDQIVARLGNRNGLTEEESKARINSQMPVEERIQYADVVIENIGSLDDLAEQVKVVWNDKLINKGLVGRQNAE